MRYTDVAGRAIGCIMCLHSAVQQHVRWNQERCCQWLPLATVAKALLGGFEVTSSQPGVYHKMIQAIFAG